MGFPRCYSQFDEDVPWILLPDGLLPRLTVPPDAELDLPELDYHASYGQCLRCSPDLPAPFTAQLLFSCVLNPVLTQLFDYVDL